MQEFLSVFIFMAVSELWYSGLSFFTVMRDKGNSNRDMYLQRIGFRIILTLPMLAWGVMVKMGMFV